MSFGNRVLYYYSSGFLLIFGRPLKSGCTISYARGLEGSLKEKQLDRSWRVDDRGLVVVFYYQALVR